ncbi:4-(cytidine 5'-diphospho)-2-C-methyl-D-erythritol kinase [Phytoactinopolyspora mesophila]|uniref:4-diphosphocytidyl-2-C-methyl-D-erythritol kinase n=1 Tax=Phytoactinopolyspora mesophila TaxID=2650750 RepID=A0A7K3M6D9_9ACTN|nr:4-(cytidine 5'-diphospho)-2-C-methyl-D-erythritol kinase [Phytoactinopolyspora mesophila]
MQVNVRVPAKINLALAIGPLRPDGFHDLATLFHAVSLYDDITVSDDDADAPTPPASAARQVTVRVDGPYGTGVPADESNLAVRAVYALADAAGVRPRASLRIRKNIPVAAGLAGGSADAAGALLACAELWGLDWPVERLAEVAASLGSDVPFSLIGGTALGTGRGERLEPQSTGASLHWVLAVSEARLSTPAVYRRLDALRAQEGPQAAALWSQTAGAHGGAAPGSAGPVVDPRIVSAVLHGDASAVAPLLTNDMQAAAVDLQPTLQDTLRAGHEAGALGGIVSGSGPTCVFLAADESHARAVATTLAATGHCLAAEPVKGPVRPVLGEHHTS